MSAFHDGSSFPEGSITPFSLTPTWATWMKDSGEGAEMMDVEMRPLWEQDRLGFFVSLMEVWDFAAAINGEDSVGGDQTTNEAEQI